MFDFKIIKERCRIGDTCSLEDSKGVLYKGEIKNIRSNTLVIETEAGQEKAFYGGDITHFELIVLNIKNVHFDTIHRPNHEIIISKKNISAKKGDLSVPQKVRPYETNKNQFFLSKVIPANGEIKDFAKKCGYIEDLKSHELIEFRLKNILDFQIDDVEKLKGKLIVYSYEINKITGKKTVYVHSGGKTVKELFELIHELTSEDNLRVVTSDKIKAARDRIKAARQILWHTKIVVGENIAIEKEKEYLRNVKMAYEKLVKEYDIAQYVLSKKNYRSALWHFENCINNNVRKEESIKNVITTLMQAIAEDSESKNFFFQKAKAILPSYESFLTKSISVLKIFEDVYYAIGDYENFLRIANQLLDNGKFNLKVWQRTQLMEKKAKVLYYKLNDDQLALSVLNDILEIDSEHRGAQELKNVIINSNSQILSNETEEKTSEVMQEPLISGISPYIQAILDNYNDYYGISAVAREFRKFDISTLYQIRKLIQNTQGRAQERAKYLLTEAKLMQVVEPENGLEFRSKMAAFCNDMATHHILEQSNNDVIRFFYNEAFALENSAEKLKAQVAYYLLTDCLSQEQLINAVLRKESGASINFALQCFFTSNLSMQKWFHLLAMLLYNTDIAASVIKQMFCHDKYRNQAVTILREWKFEIDYSCNMEKFDNIWNEARKKLNLEIRQMGDLLLTISNYSNLEIMIEKWHEPLIACKNKSWLCEMDRKRLGYIISNISSAIDDFIKASGFRNKDSNYTYARSQLNSLTEEIRNYPTKLSYETFLPLLNTTSNLLKKAFDDVVKMSEPKLNIDLLSSETVAEQNGQVTLQFQLSTNKNSSPIREITISVLNTDDVKCLAFDDKYTNPIEGGEAHIFKVDICVSEKVKEEKAVSLNVICKYKVGDIQKIEQVQRSLELYSSNEFEKINNPYAVFADGGPMIPNKSKGMFFGRESFIENIVEAISNCPSKQVIIYGQKRSGKSSVLNYLRKSLMDTGEVFCISFSMGEIIKDISEVSFYYKILSCIKEELDLKEIAGDVVPHFDLPSKSEFKKEDEENPVNTFIKYIIKFKVACSKTLGWENKNLVVMIDEFTYMYTAIKREQVSDSIMKQWKAVTQNERAQFSVVLVGQDVVPSFKKEGYARNAFGVIKDIRLTYLAKEPARDLIEKPILDKDGSSRFVGNAVDRILEYTSRNPYYIQIFCDRLVDYMNEKKIIKVTESDVYDVAQTFVKGEQALTEDKFDNLINAGEAEDLQEYPQSEILKILRNIAINTKNKPSVLKCDINALDDKEKENKILKHLVDREVLEKEPNDQYRIKVKMFQEWLLNH